MATTLPALPAVSAPNMLIAQGWKPNRDELAAIEARADFFESEDLPREVHIRVVDVYTGARIGSLIYNA
jgi:hypothetical protein